jgi:hypothetical protein
MAKYAANTNVSSELSSGEFMRPQIERAYISDTDPNMLPMLEGR